MGKKYIIEIPEDKIADFVGSTHFLMPYMMAGHIGHHDTGLPIKPYTEPDLERVKKTAHDDGYSEGYQAGREDLNRVMSNIEQVRKEAYDKGFDDGRSKCSSREYCMNESYQQGLNDAWEAARKIIHMPEGDLLNVFTECYSAVCTALQVILKYDASEAIEKIRQYYDGKQKINVGDEVGYYGVADEHGNVNYSGVVIEIRKDDYLVLEKDGKTYALKKNLVMSKTGRHFPDIAEVLKRMRGEQDE